MLASMRLQSVPIAVYGASTAAPLQRDLSTVYSKQVTLSHARHQSIGVIWEKEAVYFNIRVYNPIIQDIIINLPESLFPLTET